MKDKLFAVVLRRPVLILLACLILTAVATIGAKNLVFKSDYRVFFSEDNPQLVAYESIQNIFNKSDNVAFIVIPSDGDIYTPEHLQLLNQITTDAWQIPYSTRVDSVTNYQHTWADADDMIVEDLVMEEQTLDRSALDRIREIVNTEPILLNKIASAKGQVSLVNVTVQLPMIDPVAEVPEVVAKVREIQFTESEFFTLIHTHAAT